MNTLKTLTAGASGAIVLNTLHESARQVLPNSPHIDLVAMQGLGTILNTLDQAPAKMGTLRKITMAGDLLGNAAYYGLMLRGHERRSPTQNWLRALGWGIFAGMTVIIATPLVGLDPKPVRRTKATSLMTVLWYLTGALAANTSAQAMTKNEDQLTGLKAA